MKPKGRDKKAWSTTGESSLHKTIELDRQEILEEPWMAAKEVCCVDQGA